MCKIFKVGCGEENIPVNNFLFSPLTTPSKNIQRSIFPPIDNDAYVKKYRKQKTPEFFNNA